MVVLWLGCCLSVNTICSRIMVGLMLLSFSKHNIWSYYGWIFRCRLSVNTIYGRIIVGFVVVVCQQTQYMVVLWLDLSLSSVSKHNIWSYYGWVCRCRLSVNTIYGRIMVGFVVVVCQ